MNLDAQILERLVPVIGMVVTFAMPVVIVWVVQHFKYKNKELEADLETRKLLGERDRALLEARIERLENAVLGSLQRREAAPAVPGAAQALPSPSAAALYEPPPAGASEPGARVAGRDPTR